MRIVFYGRLAAAIGPTLDLDAHAGCSIAELRKRLMSEHPGAADALAGTRVLTCVGGSLVRDEHVIGECDEVEFLPPVSGG